MSPEHPTPKRDYRQEVTDTIIRLLEQGTAPWQKPWRAGALEMPVNPTTGKRYCGGNAMHLMAIGVREGYEDPRWMTYRQAQQEGWPVRKGAKGTAIEYWEFPDRRTNRDAGEANPDTPSVADSSRRMIHRVYTVFNARQLDGIPDYLPPRRAEFEKSDAKEARLVVGRDADSPDDLAETRQITEEDILDNAVDPAVFEQSFREMGERTTESLGDQARMLSASTDSGVYCGPIIGGTDVHILQRLSDWMTVVHTKSELGTIPDVGFNVLITYSNQHARVQDMPARTLEQELSR